MTHNEELEIQRLLPEDVPEDVEEDVPEESDDSEEGDEDLEFSEDDDNLLEDILEEEADVK